VKKFFEIRDQRIAETQDTEAPIQILFAPTDEEKKQLIEKLKLDEHTLASALDPDELARLEFEPEHVAFIFKRPRNYSGGEQLIFKTTSVGLFLFKDRLIVVSSEEFPLFDTNKTFARISRLSHVMLKLIYRSIVHFLEHLRAINMICDDLERKINTAMENRYLLNLFTLEKSMVYYLNAINSNGVLIEKMKNNSAKIGFSQEEMEFIDDMLIENNQCYKQAEIYSNILASLMDARASIVSNNLNVLMKTLNIITIGIMVPTLVVSAFSMNVSMPFRHDHPAAFWAILSLALLSVVGFYFFMKHKKWRI